MGFTKDFIVLENFDDEKQVLAGALKKEEVRSVQIEVLVDTGALTLVIDEDLRKKLGLTIMKTTNVTIAGDSHVPCGISEPVRIRWQNRGCVCEALVLPEQSPCLLGAIPLEFMDLMVDPGEGKLVGAHGDEPVLLVMNAAVPCGRV